MLNVNASQVRESTILQGKKILWISFKCTRSLGVRTSLEVLNHLVELNYDVHLLTTKSEKRNQINNTKINLISVPLQYLPIITPSLFAIILFISLPFFIVTIRPNIIITETGPSIFSFMWKLLLNPLKCKVILDIRTTPVEVNNFRRYLDQIVFFDISIKIAKKMFDGITTLTSLMKRDICEKFQIDPEFVGVWTSGVSTTLFNPEKYNGISMKKRLELVDKFIIFYHGTLYYFLSQVIESIKMLNNTQDLALFLLGSGPALPIFKKLIQNSGIQDKVIIHDAVDYRDVPKFIAMCDVGIFPLPDLPDWRHQCPTKLLEYLAMNKATIVTDIPANREVIGQSKCGIYISSVDPTEISKAIIYAYDNKDRLNEWGGHGRAIVEEKYSWKKVAKELNNYLLKCLQKD